MNPQRTPAAAYLMDGPREGRRLEAKIRSAASRRQLRHAGLAPGMDALDAGCGSGAVTRVMAAIAGPGRATGVDASASRIAQARALACDAIPADREVANDLLVRHEALSRPTDEADQQRDSSVSDHGVVVVEFSRVLV